MRTYMRWVGAAVLALGVTTMVLGAEPEAKPKDTTKVGVVKKVDLEGKKIVVTVKRDLTFDVTADTKILQGEAVKNLADIKEGATVTVEYSFVGKDTRVASKITIGATTPPEAKPR